MIITPPFAIIGKINVLFFNTYKKQSSSSLTADDSEVEIEV